MKILMRTVMASLVVSSFFLGEIALVCHSGTQGQLGHLRGSGCYKIFDEGKPHVPRKDRRGPVMTPRAVVMVTTSTSMEAPQLRLLG